MLRVAEKFPVVVQSWCSYLDISWRMTVSAGVIPHGYCIARIKGRLEATGFFFRGHRPRHLQRIQSVAWHGYRANTPSDTTFNDGQSGAFHVLIDSSTSESQFDRSRHYPPSYLPLRVSIIENCAPKPFQSILRLPCQPHASFVHFFNSMRALVSSNHSLGSAARILAIVWAPEFFFDACRRS